MSIMPIEFPGSPVAPVTPFVEPAGEAAKPGSGASFGAALAGGLEELQRLHATSNELAVRAATGDLRDVHDYTIAASQAAVATELTVALRNKGVEAFTEILRMPL